ncbi:MAG TPA: alanine--tRNA ligase [Thermoanaerobaculia bacterium]|jgi:alanyl-tRNA synthetase|nr:alanine--tRNA ligase [Thermoanaerobaculia bacterium]
MQSKDVRQSFVDFFHARGHLHVPSAPLVPHGDPTLLFTNAGMVQFKDYFLGRETPPARRAVTAQKCLRVSGKHNDLENVGPSPRHHTFFEMLGNFSFGDYFKADAIEFGWQLVTGAWGLSPDVLAATVFEQDDEAAELWRRISGLPPERIHRCGAKDNFWAMGDTGPCGPCSEIFVDTRPGRPVVPWAEGTDSGRYLEIWNLVFMQYDRAQDGTMTPLPNPSIDTGAGLERVTAVLQGVASNYDTDLFAPIIAATAELSHRGYTGGDGADDVAMRVIADHLRAVSFLLADGVIPSNDGRGYVLRRILRRAVRHGMHLGFEEPFLHRLVPVLGEVMAGFYPELGASREATVTTVRAEEEKFLGTLAAGARQVQDAIERTRREGKSTLAGPAAFQLYDTHGLPLEIIREIAEEERFTVDEAGFQTALEEQRQRSRAATGEQQKRLGSVRQVLGGGGGTATEFLGYDDLRVEGAKVLRLGAERDGQALEVPSIGAGESGVAVFDRTPFYAESGGQVGDQGEARWQGGRARVLDVHKDTSGTYYHELAVEEGRLERGAAVDLEVGESLRRDTERNHTATHLLHAALREVLGEGVRQAGSLVAPDRLRFDFTFGRPLHDDELRRIEDIVNERVRQALPTRIVVQGYQEAVARGAMALFGEKYGDRVRTVEVPGFSLELCGGCHVRNVGEIGLFLVMSERGIASGVRRIEALTGRGAVDHVRARQAVADTVAGALGAPLERGAEEARALQQRLSTTERELAQLRRQLVAGSGAAPAEQAREVAGVKVLAREVPPAPPDELRNMADMLRQKLGSGVVVLGARGDGKVSLVAAVTADLVGRLHAGNLVKAAAAAAGGKGGGRPDFAQAGGKEPDKLPQALDAAVDEVAHQLADYGGQ